MGSVIVGYRIITAEIIEASAAKTRTCPTRRIISGAIREPKRNPRKYPDMTSDISRVENPSISPRMPSTVPCMPLPTCKSIIPKSSAHALEKTENIAPPLNWAVLA